jgi:hypothetical protein
MFQATKKKQLDKNLNKINNKINTVFPKKKENHINSGLLSAPIGQKITICACDGYCPRCKYNSSIQAVNQKINKSGEFSEQEADSIENTVNTDFKNASFIQKKPHSKEKIIKNTDIQEINLKSKIPFYSKEFLEVNPFNVIKNGGKQLPDSIRSKFDFIFGYDFSQTRLHTGAKAAESARAMNALAYTIGRDIIFADGQYAPNTLKGKKILAHELTHVIQQKNTSRRSQHQLDIATTNDKFEIEANQKAEQVVEEFIYLNKGSNELKDENNVSYIGKMVPHQLTISNINDLSLLQRHCVKSPPNSPYLVDVNFNLPATSQLDHSHDTAWISSTEGDSSGQTFGFTDSKLNAMYDCDFGNRGSQHWITKLRIWFENPQIQIYITSNFPPNSCEYNDLLRHERKHETIIRNNILQAETEICSTASSIWPSQTHPLSTSVHSRVDLETMIKEWFNWELWRLEYNSWLESCAWEIFDYPRLFSNCPEITSPVKPTCDDPPIKPARTVFPLPSKQ